MNPREQGFLLLTSHLGDPMRRPLSQSQLRQLAQRMRNVGLSPEDRELERRDLMRLGYGISMADHILALLNDHQLLQYYVQQGRRQGCVCVTRVTGEYPALLRGRLGLDSPGCFWAKGDLSLLATPAISVVGSRDLRQENSRFAALAGTQAAEKGMTLVSGNARGTDRIAQDACLEAGGRVISIVADELIRHPQRENVLYLSEDGYDEAFSTPRALSRNRSIHALGQMVLVAQSDLGKGGTWDGTVRNLCAGWSNVGCFRDGSAASLELEQMGAFLIDLSDLNDFDFLPPEEYTLI